MLAVRVLGPVEVLVDGVPVDLGGMLPRRLLAALALEAGQVVPDDRLAEAMWGDRPPPKSRTAMQSYVSRLRGTLGDESLLERGRGGYRLAVDLAAVDAAAFAAAVEEGRRATAAGDPGRAAAGLTAALETWRGEPFADLASSDVVDAARGRLAELHAVAQEERAAARLADGDPAAAVAELTELTRVAPLRERRWALLARGLYRCGRQGEALAALRTVRAVLAEELGVDPGAELRELERQVLAHDPGLDPATGARHRSPLRRPLTSFLGRDGELAAVRAQLAEHRLVNLVGTAGVGKTRIAVEHAARTDGPAGLWIARLADVREPADVPTVVAAAVGLPAVPGDLTAATVRVLADQRGLLVLDNCEHVTDAAAELVLALLDGCPDLRILATSRGPLGIDGEVTLPVRPLPVDRAVELLVDRVEAVLPDWVPTADDTAAAQRIVESLDGLPLAIELAAARARLLGIADIAERLDDRFALLGAVPRGSVAAHATLEAAIGWSVDLLDVRDRTLLLRLWPFEGGFTLDAATAVMSDVDQAEPLEALSALVTRSVVAADTSSVPTRYLLLESIRAYCRSIDPDPRASRAAHARWVRGLAEGCITAVRAGRGGRYLADLTSELPNLRAGVAHDLADDPAAALHSVGSMGLFMTRCMPNAEAARLGMAVLDAAPDGDPVARGRILCSVNATLFMAGDRVAGSWLIPQMRRICASLPESDPLELCDQHYLLGFAAVMSGMPDLALEAAERAITVAERTGVRGVRGPARAVRGIALVMRALRAGDDAGVLAAAHDVHTVARGWTGVWAQAGLGEAHLHCPPGSADATRRAAIALTALREAAAGFLREADIPFGLSAVHLGVVALARVGRTDDARTLLAAVRAYSERLGIEPFTFMGGPEEWIGQELSTLDPLPEGGGFEWDRALVLLNPA
ncbi:BTAD domain-containing putative transcriptional regulator [Pseudonocardia sp. TRM90224]|uniref:BTAD domain-containing putative transcriptional regulator n=1 Tax=Pseudonocardia sp. TRM90224 TaxID=2812678 RepID=UPI001E3289F9|nr:BTAD domain-containing putative transcriptional regulator [Pseudonocardia sp. TRM90224]